MTTTAILAVASFLNYFEARNKMANFVLEPPAQGEEVKCERPDITFRMKCPACGGAGDVRLEPPDYGQSAGRIGGEKKIHKKCPLCKGAKGWIACESAEDLAMQIAKDREAFVSAHQGRGETAVGQAFVPPALKEGADRAKLKSVEDVFGKPCTCNWTGVAECRKCHGAGTLKCTAKDCKDGWEVTTQSTTVGQVHTTHRSITANGVNNRNPSRNRTTSRSRAGSGRGTVNFKTTVKECASCGGTALQICPDCEGRGAVVCKKCAGTGLKRSFR